MKVAEDLIHDKNRALVSVPKATAISEALSLMSVENVGCLLVSDQDDIVGIWTERDLARDVVEGGFDIGSEAIGKYMSLRIRHLLVKKEGRFIGLVSAGDVMKACIREKDHDLARANAALSWDYYEEWKHK